MNKQREMSGRWREAHTEPAPQKGSDEKQARISELVALPYLQGYREATREENEVMATRVELVRVDTTYLERLR